MKSMKTSDIREKFLSYFEQKGHARVPSSPLVPGNDPSLLFTNSGMVQFKDVFLGFDKRPYQRATTAQRCLRAGGKHNDLENVGYTARHHTFFEMLGNFSFGDYFKEKAIPYAWEFLTSPDYLGLKKEHLWITVFGGGKPFGDAGDSVPADDEAATLWRETLMQAGFDEAEANKRIARIPTTDNFWMMGDTGPCGPCSEIFYDKDAAADHFRGEEEAFADVCVEIWNLVFMQYNRDDNGVLHELPAPCVDTGMGLERISAVLQQKNSNYETDLFLEILAAVNDEIKKSKGKDCKENYLPSHCVVADHIRAAAFLIADGVTPSNEGRGYVLRKIIRRALVHGSKASQKRDFGGSSEKTWFCHLLDYLPEIMGAAGDILRDKREEIKRALEQEEIAFARTFIKGRAELETRIHKLKKSKSAKKIIFPGKDAFELYDTYGFPLEATKDMIHEDALFNGVGEEDFERCMNEQRQRSRAAMKFNAEQSVVAFDGAATDFVGYDSRQCEATILALFKDGEPVGEVRPGDEATVILDRTPFYAESGGQVGDSGVLTATSGALRITDTQKLRADVWQHIGRVGDDGALQVGASVQCAVDEERRWQITRNHSAAHLMHAALRQVLGRHVEQRGSQVAEKALRFDFSHSQAVTADELREVEMLVNQQIAANAEVRTELMDYDDALKTGAMALFGEKYGARVRVVTIDKAFSVELCGGTHTARAGDIGLFQFTGETAIAAGIRRVEAVTAEAAVARAQTASQRLAELANSLKTPAPRIEEKIEQLQLSLKAAQKQIDELEAARRTAYSQTLAGNAEDIGGIKTLIQSVADADGKQLRVLAMELREQLRPAAVLLIGDGNGQAALVAAVSEGVSLNANAWVRECAAVVGAKGGGKADFAQAGGGDCAKINEAIAAARAFVQPA